MTGARRVVDACSHDLTGARRDNLTGHKFTNVKFQVVVVCSHVAVVIAHVESSTSQGYMFRSYQGLD